ncbi:MAG TPA: MG2 domain-containing protein, partial [Bacteroidota bacterium]|nr:MG2 domain-containing protein [Bacteroidota bacterium]
MKTHRNTAYLRLVAAIVMVVGSAAIFIAAAVWDHQVLSRITNLFIKRNDAFPEDRVYLQCDKSLYRPGESIWFQAYVRNGEDLKPSLQSDILHVEFVDPRGSIGRQYSLLLKDGVASGDIALDEHLAGGLYKLKAYTNWQMNDKEPLFFEKEIQIQDVVLPRIKMKLEFDRKAYGAGDEVRATFAATSLENKPLARTECRIVASIAGRQVVDTSQETDKSGVAGVRFALPKNLSTADGLLLLMIEHDGETESISRSIPIVLNTIVLKLFPEGGDLVEGLRSRVAFQALNEFGKPADIEGEVVDDNDRVVSHVQSFHHGMGAFELFPEHSRYRVRITKPAGITDLYDVPEALSHGYTLGVQRDSQGNLSLKIGSTENEQMSVVAQMRGRLCFTKSFAAKKGFTTITVSTDEIPAGVVQVTLFDHDAIERAERLVFVNEQRRLRLRLTTDKEKYLPREKVELTILATDERGVPAPANLSLAVVDDKLLSFADDRSGN